MPAVDRRRDPGAARGGPADQLLSAENVGTHVLEPANICENLFWMNCPSCSSPLEPNARFCGVCGYRLQRRRKACSEQRRCLRTSGGEHQAVRTARPKASAAEAASRSRSAQAESATRSTSTSRSTTASRSSRRSARADSARCIAASSSRPAARSRSSSCTRR